MVAADSGSKLHAGIPVNDSACAQLRVPSRRAGGLAGHLATMGVYGVSKRMSRLTLTLKRYPTGILIVGCTFRLRLVICAPRSDASWPTALPATSPGLR